MEFRVGVCRIALVTLFVGSLIAEHERATPVTPADGNSAVNAEGGNWIPCDHWRGNRGSTNKIILDAQVFTAAFADTVLQPIHPPVRIGEYQYTLDLGQSGGWMIVNGPEGKNRFSVQYSVGGKRKYYFFTVEDFGRVLVLPLAFDLGTRSWLPAGNCSDQSLHGGPYGLSPFDTACAECHEAKLTDAPRTIGSDTRNTTNGDHRLIKK